MKIRSRCRYKYELSKKAKIYRKQQVMIDIFDEIIQFVEIFVVLYIIFNL